MTVEAKAKPDFKRVTDLLLPDHDPEVVDGVRRGSLGGHELGRVLGQLLDPAAVDVVILKLKIEKHSN